MGNAGDLFVQISTVCRRQHYTLALDGMGLHRGQQNIVELHLPFREGRVKKISGNAQAGAGFN
ncbi:hypothetical protein SDC9_128931 [bioreactor metagenome]|uniref:Uncharacterized protein n=1 Tax=bioreactor metagenome TaxID=1076179 RepID=A0A645CY41_9ZZZZ